MFPLNKLPQYSLELKPLVQYVTKAFSQSQLNKITFNLLKLQIPDICSCTVCMGYDFIFPESRVFQPSCDSGSVS